MKVRVTKLQGGVQMLPQYTIAGELLQELVVGGTIEVARTERNGLNISGHFESSAVVEIEAQDGVYLCKTTSGSLYRVEALDGN